MAYTPKLIGSHPAVTELPVTESALYTPHFGAAPLHGNLAGSALVDSTDTYTYTPLRNVQVIKEDPSILYNNASLHDGFLVSFIISTIIGLLQMAWRYFGIGHNKIEQIIDEKARKTVTLFEGDETRLVQVLADSHILTLNSDAQDYQSIYAVLLFDQSTKEYFIVRAKVEKDFTAGKDYEHLKSILEVQAVEWDRIKKERTAAKKVTLLDKIKKASFREIFETSLRFFFNMALRYWTLWFIAAGFVGFGGALAISFGSPVIAFVIPAVLIVVEYAVWAIYAYRNRHNVSDPKLNNIAEILLKIKLANKSMVGKTAAAVKDLAELKAWALKKDPKKRFSEDSWEKKESEFKVNLRIGLKTVTAFASFFIFISFVAWPLTDLLASQGISVAAFAGVAAGGMLSIAIVPMAMALVVGLIFAVIAYNNAVKTEAQLKGLNGKLKTTHDKFSEENVAGTLREKLSGLRESLNKLALEVELRRAYLKAKKVQGLESPVSVNNPGFSDRLSLDKRTAHLTRFEHIAHGFDTLVKALGGGALLVRLFLGFTAVFVVGGFSFSSLPVVLPLVIMAAIWGGVQILRLYEERKLKVAERSLVQISAEATVYEAENEYLKGLEATYKQTKNQVPRVSRCSLEGDVTELESTSLLDEKGAPRSLKETGRLDDASSASISPPSTVSPDSHH